MAFARLLKDVIPRLELLGFNLDRVRREYEYLTESWREERRSILDDDTEALPELMSFVEFRQFATDYALDTLDDTFVSCTKEKSEEKIRGRFADMALNRIPNYRSYAVQAYSERSFFGELVNILHPSRSCGSWPRRRQTRTVLSFGNTGRWWTLGGRQSGSLFLAHAGPRRFLSRQKAARMYTF